MTFPHERLDAWHRAREARVLALAYAETVPLGHGDEVRQIRNASASVVRNVCEGASRWRPAEKVHKFEIALGEAGEAAGAVQSLLDAGLGDAEVGARFIAAEDRAAACVMGLIRRQRRRML